MAILLDRETPVIVQGITGREGSFHAQQMQLMGTRLVGGVNPGKGGATHLDVVIHTEKAAKTDFILLDDVQLKRWVGQLPCDW